MVLEISMGVLFIFGTQPSQMALKVFLQLRQTEARIS